MEQHERDFLVSRINAGYLIYDDVRIFYPSSDILYEAYHLYCETVSKASEDGVLSESQIIDFMKSRDLWTDEEEVELSTTLPKHIEYFKVEIYENWKNEGKVKKTKKYLNRAKEGISNLFNKKHQYDHLTTHGTASYIKWLFIIENSVRRKNGEMYDWSRHSTSNVLSYLNQQFISDEKIRELARTEPFQSYWSSSQKAHIPLFPLPSIQLTEDQRRLIQYASLYETVKECEDCPTDDIINDDDAFDGWLIVRKRNQDKEKEQSKTKNTIKRSMDAQQVFIVASDEDPNALFKTDDIGKIYDMNSPQSRAIVKNRQQKMINATSGVNIKEFDDVRDELNIKTTNLIRDLHRNRRG